MIRIKNIIIVLVFICFCFNGFAQESLIPMPKQVIWGKERLNLSHGVIIDTKNSTLKKEYKDIEQVFTNLGIKVHHKSSNRVVPKVILHIKEITLPKEEAYDLCIDRNGIKISANTVKGIFYGIQTLKQFQVLNQRIAYVNIQDQPAFSWRAYLIDVGRNYQPLDMIKEQIDVMSNYKLNVLHFHFTEDIAWRLASKKYPGLTNPEVMTRWKGQYYTEADFRELIQYCKDRQVMLLPEIDMPGHSEAFKRFFGVDMQSDSGMVYIKELLKEFKETYPELEVIHIGGDEVKITNKSFMPEITKYVEDLGFKKTIGWFPGSNLETRTIHQMWMGGPKEIKETGEEVFIESKHLYVNHMDPLESVSTIFHRQIGGVNEEHKNFIGATYCSWPDRAVSKPIDMFYQSAIYPAMLAYAERIWQGNGQYQWVSNIVPDTDPDYASFVDFEKRLLTHKDRHFVDKPFPYVKQIGLKWDLIGPYANEGDITKVFAIEEVPYANDNLQVDQVVEGGTVVLKHWFGTIINSAIKDPKPNTTWYARTKIWSNESGIKPFWIGFNDFSRSYLTDSPALNTWDNRGSKVLVNGVEVKTPEWKQPGQLGEREVPFVDEGYSYREPTMIDLKEGWNEVLIKLPVAEFKGRNWENPTKWMFTFIPTENIN